MTTFKFRLPVEVRFRDCDPMGHVNNAVYLTYLEAARFAYWRTLFDPKGLSDFRFILARVECDFRAAAKPGDRLEVALATTGIGRSSFTFEYEVVNERGGLVASARTVQVMYDYSKGRSVPIPDDVRRRIEMFEGRHPHGSEPG